MKTDNQARENSMFCGANHVPVFRSVKEAKDWERKAKEAREKARKNEQCPKAEEKRKI